MGWVYSQADKMLSMNAKNLKIIGSIPHDPLSIKQARSLPSKIQGAGKEIKKSIKMIIGLNECVIFQI